MSFCASLGDKLQDSRCFGAGLLTLIVVGWQLDNIGHRHIFCLMESAKLFINGRNQAVRIPKRYRFSGDRVILKKHGSGLLLIPEEDPWAGLFEAMGQFPADFMSDGREQGEFEAREAL